MIQQDSRTELVEKTRLDNARRRERHAGKTRQVPQLTLARAREKKHGIDWNHYAPPKPAFTGAKVFDDINLDALRGYIDWMPFFNAWEFHGKYPQILSDATVGEAARSLFSDASVMLDKIIREHWLQAKAVVGLYPANTIDHDDILVFADDVRQKELMRLCHLRQQKGKPDGHAQNCLADYIAPVESGIQDFIGGFAVTAGLGIDEHVQRFEADKDDYSSILLKALADRLAEALAEYMHEQIRGEHWGYGRKEDLSNDQLIAEDYQGIRPAPGYPACPDHTEKGRLWQLLDVENSIGLQLTDSFAMFPTAAVSGFYFSHPESKYFSVGKIARDQVESFAKRKGISVTEAERWLAPNLGYDPAKANAA